MCALTWFPVHARIHRFFCVYINIGTYVPRQAYISVCIRKRRFMCVSRVHSASGGISSGTVLDYAHIHTYIHTHTHKYAQTTFGSDEHGL